MESSLVQEGCRGGRRPSAQRLTASMESSLEASDAPLPPRGCSTPYGINGILTPLPAPSHHSLVVLNALRHQWNPHCMGSNLLVYKNLWVVLRDTQRLATLTDSFQAERALCYSIKALKTNVLVDTHAPQRGL